MCSPRGRSWRATCSARATLRASACPSARPSGASRARRPHAVSAPSATRLEALVAEAQRVLTICNACRYCEGYCAVFPALERRLAFTEQDVHYLANLCHNCGACLYACQYAPPHEFDLNFPRVLAQVRKQTYRAYAWPRLLGAAFERNGVAVALATLAGFVALLALIAGRVGGALLTAHPDAQGAFYALLPHGDMVALFGVVFALAVLVLIVSFVRFWPATGERMG